MNLKKLEDRIRKNPQSVQRWFDKNPAQLKKAFERFPHLFETRIVVNENFDDDIPMRKEAAKDPNNTDLDTRPSRNISVEEAGGIKAWRELDREWWATRPYEFQLESARNGVWLGNGVGEFLHQRFDPELPDEDRVELAEAWAFRAGVHYTSPFTERMKVPTGHGMGADGGQANAPTSIAINNDITTQWYNEDGSSYLGEKITEDNAPKRRGPVPPSRNGMAEDGGQIYDEYAKEVAKPAKPKHRRRRVPAFNGMGRNGKQRYED